MKLELSKEVNIQKWQVVASYKEKVENPAFVGILKFALEQENVANAINAETLHEYLLKPLSENACENILNRLREEDYFSKYEDEPNYQLTDLGRKSAETEAFYVSKNGVLEISYCDLSLLNQKVVEIKSINRPDNLSEQDEKSFSKYIPRELKKLLPAGDSEFTLLKFEKQKDIILKKFESQVLPSRSKETLKIDCNEQSAILRLSDWKQDLNTNYRELRNDLLQKEFLDAYSNRNVKVGFNEKNLRFQQDILIKKPRFEKVVFNACELKNIIVQPNSKTAANAWHLAILRKNIKEYFYTDNKFKGFEAKKRQEFYNKYKPDVVSKNDLILDLNVKEQSFYKIAKLETADLLTF